MYGLNFIYNYDNFVSMLPQLELWEHILELPNLSLKKKIRNTLRIDRKPGCWLDNALYNSSVIVLIDFADKKYNNINVIKGYAIKHSLSYSDALCKIQHMYPDLCSIQKAYELINTSQQYNSTGTKQTKLVNLEPAVWRVKDKDYWTDRYGISIDSLKEDGVFPVNRYYIGNKEVIPLSRAYWLPSTNNPFKGKIYQPLTQIPDLKWFSNMSEVDYWYIEEDEDTIVITSSYKDMKVLSNYIPYSIIAFLSENIFPSRDMLSIIADYDRVIIWYDHDNAGINYAEVLMKYLEDNLPYYVSIESMTTEDDEYVDPSDYVHEYGLDSLHNLIDNIL